LKSVEFTSDGTPSVQKIDWVRYVAAGIEEGVRLFAAIPMILFLAQGRAIYPGSEECISEKQLNADKEMESPVNDHYGLFVGCEKCISQGTQQLRFGDYRIAMVEMKILLANVLGQVYNHSGRGMCSGEYAVEAQITPAVPYAQKWIMEFSEGRDGVKSMHN